MGRITFNAKSRRVSWNWPARSNSGGSAPERVSFALGLAGQSEIAGGFLYVAALYGPGFVFGAALGGLVRAKTRLSVIRWVIFAGAATASWYAAVRTAIELFDLLSNETLGLMIGGAGGGATGAAIVAAGALIAYPFSRHPRFVVVSVALGALAGLLLAVEIGDGPHLLFPVWQTLIAAALGAELGRSW